MKWLNHTEDCGDSGSTQLVLIIRLSKAKVQEKKDSMQFIGNHFCGGQSAVLVTCSVSTLKVLWSFKKNTGVPAATQGLDH